MKSLINNNDYKYYKRIQPMLKTETSEISLTIQYYWYRHIGIYFKNITFSEFIN